jgi:hypothetical protein
MPRTSSSEEENATKAEGLLLVRHFETVEELRAAQYNASWLCQRHGYKTPNQIRAEQKGLETDAATVVMMAA